MPTVVLLHYAAPPVIGGVERTIAYHARYLAAAGYRVQVVAGRGGLQAPGVQFQAVPWADSRHPRVLAVQQALAQGQVPPDFAALRRDLRAALQPFWDAAQVVVAHNVVTLHKNLALTAALHDLVTATATRRLIAWCHDFAWADALYRPALHPGYPWDLLRTAWPRTRYVAVSEPRAHMLARLLGLPRAAIAVVPPGVDPAAFYKLEPVTRDLVARLNLWEAEPLLLLPARITRRKNIGLALRVVAALREDWPAAALVVTGPPGPHNPANRAYLEELLRLRADLGLTQAVHFLYQHGPQGEPWHVPEAVVADLYRLADALLFPSRREGFGIPVLEAGLARLPAFVADIPELRAAGGPDVAARFAPDADPAAVAATIRRVLSADPLYRQRRRVVRTFRWARIVQHQVLPLLQEVSS